MSLITKEETHDTVYHHVHISPKHIVVAVIALSVFIGGAIWFASGMTTGSKAAPVVPSGCRRVCFGKGANKECETICSSSQPATQQTLQSNPTKTPQGQGGSSSLPTDKDPRTGCHVETFECNCKTKEVCNPIYDREGGVEDMNCTDVEKCQTCSKTVCD